MDLKIDRVYISRHMVFNKTSFPFSSFVQAQSIGNSLFKNRALPKSLIHDKSHSISNSKRQESMSNMAANSGHLTTSIGKPLIPVTQSLEQQVPQQESNQVTRTHHMVTRSQYGKRRPKVFLSTNTLCLNAFLHI